MNFEQTQLQNELEAINFQLNWLYQRGCNDERLVSRKREIELYFRRNRSVRYTYDKGKLQIED